ncbi:MAG TPA: peptide transporter, partial [Methylibium sp.]
LDQTTMSAGQQPANWSSAMTYKFVGALRSLTDDKPYQRTAIWVGVLIGLLLEVARKLLRASESWRRWVQGSARVGFSADFVMDAFILPSPYAFSFGAFLSLATSSWFAAGGILSSALNSLKRPGKDDDGGGLPSDMSTTSLVGGGLIAGDALAALGLGVAGLLATVLG